MEQEELVIVSKFGGTSNATAEAVAECVDIVRDENHAITVVSAPGVLNHDQYVAGEFGTLSEELVSEKVTNLLLGAHEVYQMEGEASDRLISAIEARYDRIVRGLGYAATDLHGEWLDNIGYRVEDAIKNGEDYASMLGERLQSEIYEGLGFTMLDPAQYFERGERPAELADVWTNWLWDLRFDLSNAPYILPGNTWHDGERLRTFDRGGSDISGALAAIAIDADVYRNMTDTSARSTNPKLFDEDERNRVVHVPELTYREGRELGRNGTGLLHAEAMVPLMGSGIPTEIINTFDRSDVTVMSDDPERERDGEIMAMSFVNKVAFFNFYRPGSGTVSGSVDEITTTLADAGISMLELVGNGADSLQFWVKPEDQEQTEKALKSSGIMEDCSVNEKAVITIVGHNIRGRSGEVLQALEEFDENPRACNIFAQAQHSLRYLMHPDDAEEVFKKTHERFIESK